MINLFNKRIILGVCGGIAAYKSAELCRLLKQAGAEVQVVMTMNAKAFITPLTLQALSQKPVRDQLMDTEAELGMGHIELARWADAIIIAPASANTIAKLAQGTCDDLLTTLVLASRAQKGIAPAMNQAMWHEQTTQANVERLKDKGFHLIGPAAGEQACGDVGLGRMSEPQQILTAMSSWYETGKLAGKSVLITAGPTQEPIDPVRYLSNRSSGKMGAALAQAAYEAGAKVTIISGPVHIAYPSSVQVIRVQTAAEMHAAVMENAKVDLFIASAAVADYRPLEFSNQKLKKSDENLKLVLERTEDILLSMTKLSRRPVCVGFAAESEHVLEYARKKLINKGCDYIIANDISQADRGFAVDDNAVMIVTRDAEVTLELANKAQIAREIIDTIATRSFL